MKISYLLACVLAFSGLVVLLTASAPLTALAEGTGKNATRTDRIGTSGAMADPAGGHTYPGTNRGTGDRSESAIKDDVKRALKPYPDVDISVDDRVVRLSGEVESDAQRRSAIEAATRVQGVHSVEDQMSIKGTQSQSVGEYIDDAAITAAVKSKILMEKGLSTFDISVESRDGVVTLTGSADSRANVDKAGRVAQSVKGVKRVDNKLLVKP